MMHKIWANVLVNGGKTWSEVPEYRRIKVKMELQKRVDEHQLDEYRYKEITGEEYTRKHMN